MLCLGQSPKHNTLAKTASLLQGGRFFCGVSWFNVLPVMNLQEDFLHLAADDVFGKKMQDLELLAEKKK